MRKTKPPDRRSWAAEAVRKADLLGRWTMLFMPVDVERDSAKLAAALSTAGHSCVYVTLRKPHFQVAKLLAAEGAVLKNISFADAVSLKGGNDGLKTGEIVYLHSAENVDDLCIAIDTLLPKIGGVKKTIFLDSLSHLLLYHPASRVAYFSKFLASKAEAANSNIAFSYFEKQPQIHDALVKLSTLSVTSK